MEEIRITLETLYDILRNEKKRGDLQKLKESFFFDVVNYLKEKKSLLESKKNEDDLFAVGEREKLDYELRSIRKILKEIYDSREKKLIDIALNKSRTNSDIIDTGAMLREEKDFYLQLITLLDGYRSGILMAMFKGETPFFQRPEIKLCSEPPTLIASPETSLNPKIETRPSEEKPEESLKTNASPPLEEIKLKKICFTQAVPSFIWKDLKEYGPFEEGEETEIFPEVAELIVKKCRAVFVN